MILLLHSLPLIVYNPAQYPLRDYWLYGMNHKIILKNK